MTKYDMNGKPVVRGKQARALKERNIVDACRRHVESKCLRAEEQRAQLKRELEAMTKEVIRKDAAGEDEVVLERMLDEIDFKKQEIEFKDGTLSSFTSVKNVLQNLTNEIDALLALEWYSYVIRTIPERKLPKLIRSEKPQDLIRVMELANEILSKIEDKIALDLTAKKEYDRAMRLIKETAREIKEKNGVVDADIRKRLNDLKAVEAEQKAARVMPVPARRDTAGRVKNLNS